MEARFTNIFIVSQQALTSSPTWHRQNDKLIASNNSMFSSWHASSGRDDNVGCIHDDVIRLTHVHDKINGLSRTGAFKWKTRLLSLRIIKVPELLESIIWMRSSAEMTAWHDGREKTHGAWNIEKMKCDGLVWESVGEFRMKSVDEDVEKLCEIQLKLWCHWYC